MKLTKPGWMGMASLLLFGSVVAHFPNEITGSLMPPADWPEDSMAPLIEINKDDSYFDYLGELFGFPPNEIAVLINLFKVGMGLVPTIQNLFTKNFNGSNVDFSFLDFPGAHKDLLSMFQLITHRLDQIQLASEGTEASLRHLVQGLPFMIRWEVALDTLEEYTRPINNLYHRFAFYQTHRKEVEEHTLVDFAENVVSHDTRSIQSLTSNIHSLAAPSDPPVLKGRKNFGREEYEVYSRVTSKLSSNMKRHYLAKFGRPMNDREVRDTMAQLSLRPSIFQMLLDAIENYSDCSKLQTPQQLIFGLFTILGVTQAKAYAMVRFSYEILKYYGEGKFSVEKQLADDLYHHYSRGILEETKAVLEKASSGYRRCDPERHVEGKTYVKVTGLLQGYIENEVDLNTGGTCTRNCGYYEHSDIVGCFKPATQFCAKERRCKGRVHSCRFIDADADVCLSSEEHRRYDWIYYENGVTLGRKTACKKGNKIKVDSWWRFLYHCSYCVCLCDDIQSDLSDRFISLWPSVSDVANNKVVTGLRFTKKNRVIHIEVQEAKALPQGQVDPQTISWRDVEPIDVKKVKYRNGHDYFTLRYEARDIDLDKLVAPKHHVVTGLRFRMLGPHVNLEMWVTPIDFETGILKPKLSYWVSNDNTPAMALNPRKEISLFDPDDPTKTEGVSQVSSHSDTFIKLQSTSVYKDVAQSTVPFFDAQKVSPKPFTWLHGVELYHRGRKGFGGFLGFQVFNYNLTRHLIESLMVPAL